MRTTPRTPFLLKHTFLHIDASILLALGAQAAQLSDLLDGVETPIPCSSPTPPGCQAEQE